MPVYGMLRVKNEACWIERVVRAILPVCDRIYIMDDHSKDETPDLLRVLDPKVLCWTSPFDKADFNEARDKDWLLARIYDHMRPRDKLGNPFSPYWALCIDGDEELEPEGPRIIADRIREDDAHALMLRIPFLWDKPDRVRIDRVYGQFARVGRPSLFRLMNEKFSFLITNPGNGNLHCSSIPQEMLHHRQPCGAALVHWGYLNRQHRLEKFESYNRLDPGNASEDCYRHVIQGDVPEIPVSAELLHAGPMEFCSLSEVLSTPTAKAIAA